MSNIQPYIIINGVNSRTISGLLITSLPPISKPQQRTQVETVDGRSGDIITPLGFSAYDKTVSIGLTYNYDIDEIIEFFNTSGTVIFSNEPTKYYRFAIYEQIDFEKLIKFKTAEVVLHVQPYKFSTTEEPLLFNDPTEISVENNGNTDARPNLLITGSGEIDVSLNGSQLLSMDLGEDDQTVIIDSENMNAYGAQSAIREVVADIEPIQAGSGDPSPDNVREIIGFTKIDVMRTGVNQWDEETEIGGINWTTGSNSTETDRLRSKNYIPVLPNTAYYMASPAVVRYVWFYDANKNIIEHVSGNNNFIQLNTNNFNFTTPYNAYYCRFITWTTYGTTYNNDISVNYPASDTDYHAYNGSIYNIAFTDGDNPLTVYGGKLNVTTGKLTITHALKAFDGSEDWRVSTFGETHYRAYVAIENIVSFDRGTDYITDKVIACNMYKIGTWYQVLGGADICGQTGKNVGFGIDSLNITSVQGWITWLSNNNLYIVYELAEPVEIQIEPVKIHNLIGLNNLYSDTGDLSVKYKSGGVIQTQTGDIVTFTVGVGDMDKGTLLNRLITGNYDKIRLKKGENVISFTGNVKQVSIDKYSRWI